MDFARADALNTAIRIIAIRHRARADALLAEHGLHTAQELLLFALAEHGPMTQKQLADAAACEPPSVTGMARKLEAAGLVERRASERDARATVVTLTEKGRALIGPLKELWCRLAEETQASLARTSPDELLPVLEDLAEGLRAWRR